MGWNLPELGWTAETDAVKEQQLKWMQWVEVAEADAIREQQLQQTQSGSSSQSGRNQGEQQLSRRNRGAAAEADATQKWTQLGSSS